MSEKTPDEKAEISRVKVKFKVEGVGEAEGEFVRFLRLGRWTS